MSPSRRTLAGVLALVLGTSALQSWWAVHRDDDLGREIAAVAGPGDILMVSSTTCVFCHQARQWMQAHGVAFTECFIERDAACAARYQALMSPGTPVLLVRGQMQLGFDAPRVLRGLGLGVRGV